jgi:hypothetical protein
MYIYIYIANWDGMMKLKLNKTSIKESRVKIWIKKIRTEVEKLTTKDTTL